MPVQTTVDRRVGVATAKPHGTACCVPTNTATRSAKTARRFVSPFDESFLLPDNGAGDARHAQTGSRRRGNRNGVSFRKTTTTGFMVFSRLLILGDKPATPPALRPQHCRTDSIVLHRRFTPDLLPPPRSVAALSTSLNATAPNPATT